MQMSPMPMTARVKRMNSRSRFRLRYVLLIALAELRQYTATFQFHSNILLFTYLLVELGDSGVV